MNKSLLDTDIYSEVLKGRNANVAAKAAAYQVIWGRITVTSLTVLEVVKGLHKRQLTARLQKFLASLSSIEVLPLDLECAELAGRMYGDLERTGQAIGRIDPMVAGITLHHGLTLVTGNTGHYQRLLALGYPLILEDWRV